MGLRNILAATVLPLLTTAMYLGAYPQAAPASFDGVRDRIVRAIEERDVPSVSLAVVRDGEIVWEEAFGLADLENKIKATPGTIYPIASATKPFTATALMILVERGLVNLDRPANDFLKGAGLRAYEGDAARATLRRILHHTSGLPMYWNFYYEGTSRRRPPFETTLRRYGILVSPPGEGYDYSNLGYAVLESVIEGVSGRPYAEFLAAEVFKPLGLSRTAVVTAPPAQGGVAVKYGPSLARVPFCDHETRGAGAIHAGRTTWPCSCSCTWGACGLINKRSSSPARSRRCRARAIRTSAIPHTPWAGRRAGDTAIPSSRTAAGWTAAGPIWP